MSFASRCAMTAAALTLKFYKPAGMDTGDSRECVRGRRAWEPGFTSLAALRRAPRSNCRCRALLPSGILQSAGSAGSGPAAWRKHFGSERGKKHDRTGRHADLDFACSRVTRLNLEKNTPLGSAT